MPSANRRPKAPRTRCVMDTPSRSGNANDVDCGTTGDDGTASPRSVWSDSVTVCWPAKVKADRSPNARQARLGAAKMCPVSEPRKTPPSHQQQGFLRGSGRHLRSSFGEKHVDFTTHSEPAGKVNPRLHGEPDPGHQLPRIGGLEVVQMGSAAVQLAVDLMPCSMDED